MADSFAKNTTPHLTGRVTGILHTNVNILTMPQDRSTHTRVACALLAAWIFILSLAGVSPALHGWLHADIAPGCAHGCGTVPDDAPAKSHEDGHYCGVIALQGTDAPVIDLTLPERNRYERFHFEPVHERLHAHASQHRLQARAPPIEI